MSSNTEKTPSGDRNERPRLKGKRFGSLGWRILFWMSLVGLGPLLIMAYQGYHCASQAVLEQAHTQLRSVVNSRKVRIMEWLAERKADMHFISITPCAHGGCSCRAPSAEMPSGCNVLENVQKRSPAYESIIIYDLNWKIILQTVGAGNNDRYRSHGEFKSALSERQELMLCSPRLQTNGTLISHLGLPVISSGKEIEGYILASLNLSLAIDPILKVERELGKSDKAYLVFPSTGRLYIPTGVTAPSVENGFPLSAVLKAGGSSMLEYEDNHGERVLGISDTIPELGAAVIVDLDRGVAFAWLGELKQRALITGSITLVIVLVIAFKSSQRLSRPLRELAAISRRIAGGRHQDRLGQLKGTEAQEVARAFNTMLDELAASQRLLTRAASLAAVGELSSSIVHEMRNPLSSIKLNLQALRRRVSGDKAHQELAEIALSQAGRLERMLTDLLGYGKPLELEPRAINLGELIAEVLEVLWPQVESKDIEVEVVDHLGRIPLIADSEGLRRVLTNLLTNAFEAVPQTGKVILRAEIFPAEEDKAVISVSDNGPGIDPSSMEKIFQPFFTTRETGTGLGLANVKKIIECHGGTVTAENLPGAGAVFNIVLPLGGPPV